MNYHFIRNSAFEVVDEYIQTVLLGKSNFENPLVKSIKETRLGRVHYTTSSVLNTKVFQEKKVS